MKPSQSGTNGLQSELFALTAIPAGKDPVRRLIRDLEGFREFGTRTVVKEALTGAGIGIPAFVNEFWTSKQRAASSLHEISYRACFKPQLPRFFIERLTEPGDVVFDPFMGRGTTLLEAALLGRTPAGCDVNPLAAILVGPRLDPPDLHEIQRRLESIPWHESVPQPDDLLAFYHPETLNQITALRHALDPANSPEDAWIRMVATNRLTGHSAGFLSVYTLPPNQAVSVERQRKINARRKQTPEFRDVAALILRKSRSLLSDVTRKDRSRLARAGASASVLTCSCERLPEMADESVSLVVTSPPFLDVVNYQADNWLRCWFNRIDPDSVDLWVTRRLEDWSERMTRVFRELRRILKAGGFVAFEVGEVRKGTIRLEEAVIPAAEQAGLQPALVLINQQDFTKTANCWGVTNMSRGTNTNRVVLLRKP